MDSFPWTLLLEVMQKILTQADLILSGTRIRARSNLVPSPEATGRSYFNVDTGFFRNRLFWNLAATGVALAPGNRRTMISRRLEH